PGFWDDEGRDPPPEDEPGPTAGSAGASSLAELQRLFPGRVIEFKPHAAPDEALGVDAAPDAPEGETQGYDDEGQDRLGVGVRPEDREAGHGGRAEETHEHPEADEGGAAGPEADGRGAGAPRGNDRRGLVGRGHGHGRRQGRRDDRLGAHRPQRRRPRGRRDARGPGDRRRRRGAAPGEGAAGARDGPGHGRHGRSGGSVLTGAPSTP